MRRIFVAAVLVPFLFLSATAQDLSREAKLLLYCTAASVVAGKQLGGDAVANAIAKVISLTGKRLALEGLNDELIGLLAITSVEQVLDELQNNRPRCYSKEECEYSEQA